MLESFGSHYCSWLEVMFILILYSVALTLKNLSHNNISLSVSLVLKYHMTDLILDKFYFHWSHVVYIYISTITYAIVNALILLCTIWSFLWVQITEKWTKIKFLQRMKTSSQTKDYNITKPICNQIHILQIQSAQRRPSWNETQLQTNSIATEFTWWLCSDSFHV